MKTSKELKPIEAVAKELLSLYDMQPDHDDAPFPNVRNISNIIKQYLPIGEPLTDEQIEILNDKYGYFEFGDAQGGKTRAFVRSIEEMHGRRTTK